MKNIGVLNTNAVVTLNRKDPPGPVRYWYSIRPAGGSFILLIYQFYFLLICFVFYLSVSFFASLFPVLHDDSFPGIRHQFPTVLP